MADRPERPERDNRRGGRKGRKKVCGFCVDKVESIDYKDVARLRRYISASQSDRHLRPPSARADCGH